MNGDVSVSKTISRGLNVNKVITGMARSGIHSPGRFLRSNGTQLVILRGSVLSLFDLVEGKMELVVNSDLFATGRNIATIHFSGTKLSV